MQTTIGDGLMPALFGFGGGEIILILSIILILFGAKKLPELGRGLGKGLTSFRDASSDVFQAVDDEASEAGRSLGGIYGKPAAQAVTPENQVAELYRPAAFQDEPESPQTHYSLQRFLTKLWAQILRFVTGS